jgi:hypothetical protein
MVPIVAAETLAAEPLAAAPKLQIVAEPLPMVPIVAADPSPSPDAQRLSASSTLWIGMPSAWLASKSVNHKEQERGKCRRESKTGIENERERARERERKRERGREVD